MFQPEGGFAGIVRQHQAMVFSIAYHFLRDRARAEDLAQDVFLHLHKSLRQIESAAHLTFWLRRVTTHRCIDESRRRKLRKGLSLTEYLEHAPEPRAESAESDPLLSDLLRRHIARLPERARMMVVLRYQEELDPAAIAETMDVPLGTVKSSLHRSLAILRGKLERERKGAAR